MGMIDMLKSAGFISIFVISIIAFSVLFASDNSSDITLGDDPRFSELNKTLRSESSNLAEDSSTASDILFKTTLESGDEHASTGGQFKIGPISAGKITVSSFKTGFEVIFGSGSQFSFIPLMFGSLMTFIISYFIIKAWLGRDPE